MAIVKVSISSNHEDGDSFQNVISLELNDDFFNDIISVEQINWIQLNASILSYPDYNLLVKDEIVKNKIEIPDPNYWVTTGIVVSFNSNSIPDEIEMYEIEDKLMTGDLL